MRKNSYFFQKKQDNQNQNIIYNLSKKSQNQNIIYNLYNKRALGETLLTLLTPLTPKLLIESKKFKSIFLSKQIISTLFLRNFVNVTYSR